MKTVVVLVIQELLFLTTPSSSLSYDKRNEENSLTAEDIKLIVDLHNSLRNQENSSDMNFMKWNYDLAKLAYDWAKRCSFERNNNELQVNDSSTKFYGGSIGHLVHTSERLLELADIIKEWYRQKEHYHYDINACDIHFSCDKYTQLVWSTSRYIGCSRMDCHRYDRGLKKLKVYSFICNYAPSGNVGNKKPHRKGKPCTQCKSLGHHHCFKGLCRDDCISTKEPGCTCEIKCHNCAKLDIVLCRCRCEQGWMGPDCSDPCMDYHVNCGSAPGWPVHACKSSEWNSMTDRCPATCGLCKTSDKPPACLTSPCHAQVCRNGAAFDAKSCRCICPLEYTGRRCDLNALEHDAGMIVKVQGPIHKWTKIWKFLPLMIANQINHFCTDDRNYGLCCTTSQPAVPGQYNRVYTTDTNIRLGTNYPILDPEKKEIFQVLMYAVFWPKNTLCHTKANPATVPQEVLVRNFQTHGHLIEELIEKSCTECSLVSFHFGNSLETLGLSKGNRLGFWSLWTLFVCIPSTLILLSEL